MVGEEADNRLTNGFGLRLEQVVRQPCGFLEGYQRLTCD
jgi:hypothetical protein